MRASVAVIFALSAAAAGLPGCRSASGLGLPFLSSRRDEPTISADADSQKSPFYDSGRNASGESSSDGNPEQTEDGSAPLVSHRDDLEELNAVIRDLPEERRRKIIAQWKSTPVDDRPVLLRLLRNERLKRNLAAGSNTEHPPRDQQFDAGNNVGMTHPPQRRNSTEGITPIGHSRQPGGQPSTPFSRTNSRVGDGQSRRNSGGDFRIADPPEIDGPEESRDAGSFEPIGDVDNRRVEETEFDVVNRPAFASGYSAEWNSTLQELIRLTEAESSGTPAPSPKEELNHLRREAYQRLLYVLTGETSKAVKAISHLPADDVEFWQKTMWGLSAYLDDADDADRRSRATRTIRRFSEAIDHLRPAADLMVRNLVFCRKINSYGNYETVAATEFRPGEQVLLYAEIENFTTERTPEGHHRTRLKSEIELFLKTGGEYRESIKKFEFRPTEDVCRNYRRDYFHSYIITLPQRLRLGDYVLKLTVEDHVGNKISTDTVQFTVK